MTKTCSRPDCEQANPQPFEEFGRSKTGKFGLMSMCRSCNRKKAAAWAVANPERVKTQNRQYYQNNKETFRIETAIYRATHKEEIKVKKLKWADENKEYLVEKKKQWYQDNKEEKKAYEAEYRTKNRGKHRADRKKYKLAKRNAVPTWLTKEQLEQIQHYYDAAQWATTILEELIVVDHIVPLQGKNVRGLHVPWNLQLLTEEENCRKGNKL